MPNNNSPQTDNEADFSRYLKEEPGMVAPYNQPPQSPLQEMQASPKFSKRVLYLIIFFAILAIAQIVMLVVWNQSTTTEIPKGYQMVTPPNQPAHIEPIK